MLDSLNQKIIYVSVFVFTGLVTISTFFLKAVRKSEIYNNDGTTKFITRKEYEKDIQRYQIDNNRMFRTIQSDIDFLKNKLL